jgi:hypothetical protein
LTPAPFRSHSVRMPPASIYGGKYRGPPMDLGNMRENGVRSLLVECRDCRHTASVNVDGWPDGIAVPGAARRFKCSVCGSKAINTRPDWSTQVQRYPMGRG